MASNGLVGGRLSWLGARDRCCCCSGVETPLVEAWGVGSLCDDAGTRASPGAVYAGGGMDSMLPVLARDMRERDVPMLVALRRDRIEFIFMFMFAWLRLCLLLGGLILRGCGMASEDDDSASSHNGSAAGNGPASWAGGDGGAWCRSGDSSGSNGRGGGLRSPLLLPTGVGGRRRGRWLRSIPAVLIGLDDERAGDRMPAGNGGRGGKGGNLEEDVAGAE